MSRIFKWSNTGTIVEYPNATHFAFNPAIIKITGIPAKYDTLGVTIYHRETDTYYREYREPFRGAAYFDIRRYLQIIFNAVAHSNIRYGEAFVDSQLKQTARITVSWYSGNVQIDGKQSGIMFYNHDEDAAGATPYHRYLLNPAKVINPSTIARSVHVAVPHSLVLKNDEEAIGMVGYTLDIDRSANGVYLRWIDQQGRYCYYLFREIGSASTVSASSTWERNDMNVPTAYIDGVNIETSVRQSISRKKTRSLGAKLVDSETYDFLLSLAQSVVVDVFDGYDANDAPLWHRVNIVAGNYEKTAKHYQDFIFSIEEPAQSAQTL